MSRRAWIGIALAVGIVAASALIVSMGTFHRRGRPQVFFEPRPLVEIYRETITNGFAPYFECRDPQRFASTFQRRQGKPLRMAVLPAGREIVGLANAGGLSRKTTAMLGYDHQQPIMVFVDRLEADQPAATENSDPGLFVHRKVYQGLVIYEVSPFPDARFADYLLALDQRDGK